MRKLHLISNAHLDPVWQWQWPEGAAAAISTFRVAAELCEKYDRYVFCHNEAVLYMWVKEYEPQLFERIKKLVAAGRWKIIGGWLLQPDCNLPSGESITRQILVGQTFFEREFGVTPTTAVSFDAFGHTRGLVQILEKAGYNSYLYMRPNDGPNAPEIPQVFKWMGFADSCVIAHRLCTGYNTPLGHASEVIEAYLSEKTGDVALRCWGVGDHGGGPSKKDVADLEKLIDKYDGKVEILHSCPEDYFAEAVPTGEYAGSLWNTMPGCYVSQAEIKQRHRQLENKLVETEKMASAASMQGLMEYPVRDFADAWYDLLFCEFHDILPGTQVQPAERDSLRMMDHGLEILDRIATRAFFALSAGQPAAREGEIPVLVYNPHPYPVTDEFSCEFMLADQNWKEEFTVARLRGKDGYVPCQVVKEESCLPLDWRKRIVFRATLAPMQMNRFDAELYVLPEKPSFETLFAGKDIEFDNGEMKLRIGRKTGLIESYRVNGRELLSGPAGALTVYEDNEDPWRMDNQRIVERLGQFRLMSPKRAARFAGVARDVLEPLHVIEDGEVMTAVEGLFEYEGSTARVVYRLPKQGTVPEIDITVYFMEKNRTLRCEFPTALNQPRFFGQTMFGVNELATDGSEQTGQKWLLASDGETSFGVVNDSSYGCCWKDGAICQSLLRSAAYTAHPLPGRITMPSDRFAARIDQGERHFKLWLCGGPSEDFLAWIDRIAQQKAEPPMPLNLFPCGGGELPRVPLTVFGARLNAFKRAEDGNGWILRLFNPLDASVGAEVVSELYGVEAKRTLKPFEVITLRMTEAGFTDANLL